mmetsp:Transcript_27144/g.79265  ORF Transcript_27144/g.79265 Transcript_27144/m.79265 type:complete len:288 (+) Transcript_27144:514-1377(+)
MCARSRSPSYGRRPLAARVAGTAEAPPRTCSSTAQWARVMLPAARRPSMRPTPSPRPSLNTRCRSLRPSPPRPPPPRPPPPRRTTAGGRGRASAGTRTGATSSLSCTRWSAWRRRRRRCAACSTRWRTLSRSGDPSIPLSTRARPSSSRRRTARRRWRCTRRPSGCSPTTTPAALPRWRSSACPSASSAQRSFSLAAPSLQTRSASPSSRAARRTCSRRTAPNRSRASTCPTCAPGRWSARWRCPSPTPGRRWATSARPPSGRETARSAKSTASRATRCGRVPPSTT